MQNRLRGFTVLSLLFLMALLAGCGSSSSVTTPAPGVTRTFFIAAEDVDWDYANGTVTNQIAGIPFAADPDAPTFTDNVPFSNISSAVTANPAAIGGVRIGKVYKKTLYFEYTDATFTTKKPVPAEWKHLGQLGPIIRAEVGDTIKITFKNKTSLPNKFTMHPHGVFYNKDSEGAAYVSGAPSDFIAGNGVAPGATFDYTWEVPERAGPGPGDGPSVMWMYHSHVNEPQDENSGLVGPMIIYKKGVMKAVGATGIDREFVVLFKVHDENDSFHLENNIQTFTGAPDPADPAISGDPDFQESNLMHSMNGYIYGNLPLETMTMKKGENVRWYLMAMGTEVDLHTPHWHGNSLLTMGGLRTDVVDVLPAQMVMADMTPDNIGTWLFHCHVNDHIKAGMIARYKVDP
jgi:FtsP/CotA-like multicopper oxidase with cupredoxin domain